MKMLNQDNRLLLWVPDGGIDDISEVTVDELGETGVLDISCLVTKNNFALGATGDETIDDPALCAPGSSPAPGITSYEAGMDFFRWTTTLEDVAWTTFTGKGIPGFLVQRIGKPHSSPIIATDKISVYGVITGTPRNLAPTTQSAWEKFRQEFMVQSELVDERAVVVA